ncbi:MAG: HD domain-containing phosphohydrolase [Nitrospirota bacterium]
MSGEQVIGSASNILITNYQLLIKEIYFMELNVSLGVSAFLAGVTNLFLVGLVFFSGRKSRINNILILNGIILALWNFVSLGVYFSLSVAWALIWLKFYYISLVFIPSVFFHLVSVTIADHRLMTKRLCQSGYFLSYLFLILSAIGGMSHDVNYTQGCYYPIGGGGDILFFSFFILAGVYSLLTLAHRKGTTTNIIEKRHLQWLFLGGYINILGISSNLLCLVNNKIYPLGHLACAIYPLIIGYGIVRHRLITLETKEIEISGRKFIYLGLSSILFVLFLVSLLTLETMFRRLIGYNSLLPAILIIMILTFLFQFGREKIQTLIDKYFFFERLNQEQMVKDISRKITSIFDKEILLDIFLNSIVNRMHIRNACVILFDEFTQMAQVSRAVGLDIIKRKIMKFNSDSGLIHRLMQTKMPIIKEKEENSPGNYQREIKKDFEGLNAIICIPLTCKDKLLGMLAIGEKLSLEPYKKEEIEILSILCNEAGVAIENAHLYHEKMRQLLNTIQSLLVAAEAKDPYIHGHCERVADYSAKIAQELGLDAENVETTKITAFLHDLGNIGVSNQILHKKGRLTIEEFENVKRHTAIGAKILEPICSKKEIIEGIKFHHERMDGSGYPWALNDKMVPLIAKIITVADVYDAMTSTRPYRKAFTPEDAISELKRGCGYEFDGKVVSAFIKALNKDFNRKRILRNESRTQSTEHRIQI